MSPVTQRHRVDKLGPSVTDEVADRERAFWDAHASSLNDCLRSYEQGPDPNTEMMLDAIGPLSGKRVLDFACGAGVTSAWLAASGADVVALDLSEASIECGRQLMQRLGLHVEFVAGELQPTTFEPESFDAVVGRYALHHTDLEQLAPILRALLAPGGRGAFVETMALNPVLNFARKRLSGRVGVAKYGSDDEHPLTRADLDVLGSIGNVELDVAQLRFLRILDRNVMRYRSPLLSKACAAIDDALQRCGLGRLSYHQIVSFSKS
ncbi:MAG TPA: class I SAM-dependent methyltransferase [Solirubrobacteraceae bacterium]|nr:class I SAM-dependent methyltransferase [Solirubrobacteraceae bacterium]